MKNTDFDRVLVIGSGLSGLSAAVTCAENGLNVLLVSPYPSERSQSVMAAGGINAAIDTFSEGDTPEMHAEDTYRSACFIEDRNDIDRMCRCAPGIIRRLEETGVVFNRCSDGGADLRSFGGQSRRRTAFAGAATGKLLVTAMTAKCREYECTGRVVRRTGLHFYEALIHDGICYGAVFYDEIHGGTEAVYSSSVIMATGGQNVLFGKTTGSMLCNGYAVAKLFGQGAALRNLEFIQYHPTTIETSHKRMLITEAARGEGGRLFYEQDGRRVYFMEEMYGPGGNLMTRDVVSRCMYNAPSQVFLDISFLGRDTIQTRLPEVASLCSEYIGLDVAKDPVPVAPSVHFFMGGLKVDGCHRTSIENLYAVGECASKYHGANRLGGNSLLAALYSGMVAGETIAGAEMHETEIPCFDDCIESAAADLGKRASSASRYPAAYIYRELAGIMNGDLGIVRDGKRLEHGIESIEFYENAVRSMSLDPDVSLTEGYSLGPVMLLAKAVLKSALAREESRGAHYRSDFPETRDEFAHASTAVYSSSGQIDITFDD